MGHKFSANSENGRLDFMWIIAGLGNPGEKFDASRHNLGRDVVKNFSTKNNFPQFVAKSSLSALISEGLVLGEKVLLVLPETFMNASGKSVKRALDLYPEASVLVVYDDVDIPLGSIKISFNKNSGGHKGVQSIIDTLGNKAFARLRLGICPITPLGIMNKQSIKETFDDFVIGRFKPHELGKIESAIKMSEEIIAEILRGGIQNAMDKYNTSDTYGKSTTTE
jgi:peptidyl-tRNA hydrolase, PTH1 family